MMSTEQPVIICKGKCRSCTVGERRVKPLLTERSQGGLLEVVAFDLKEQRGLRRARTALK